MEAPLAYAIARIEKALKELTTKRVSAWELESDRLARAIEKAIGWAIPRADDKDWFYVATTVQQNYEEEI